MHIWVKSRTEQMVKSYPYFKNILVFNDVRTRRYDEKVKFDIRSKLNFFRVLRKESYDLIFDLAGLFWTAMATYYAAPGYSAGFNFHGFGFVYNFEVEAIYNGHLIDKNLNLITRNLSFKDLLKNVDFACIKPKYYITEDSRNKIEKLFTENNISNGLKNIVILTSAGWRAKIWDVFNFIELINQLDDRLNIILVGGNEDSENAALIKCSVNKKVYDFIGQLSINESAEVIRRSHLFIGSDSGPLYIAEAVGTRTLSLFGPTNPLFSAPRGSMHKYVYKELICSASKDEQNCKLLAGLNCKTFDCMKMITIEDLLSGISFPEE